MFRNGDTIDLRRIGRDRIPLDRDHGFVINAYESQIDILKQSGVPGIEAYADVFQETLDNVKSLTPIDITMQLVSWNVFCGSLLALPTALFVMKRKKE